jgi:hypothetical protein
MGEAPSLPAIPLPRRLDRHLRLGPFPSARDAMKFAGYASAGAILVPLGGALAWLPILSIGFFLSVFRPDGKGLDERAHDYLRWRWRRRRGAAGESAPPGPAAPAGVLRLPGPCAAAVLETGGIPIRFLPPGEAHDLFDRFRETLRTVDGGLFLEVGTAPVPASGFRLRGVAGHGPREAAARSGYSELTKLLLHRRQRRRVQVVVFEADTDPSALRRLEERAAALASDLTGLGIGSRRLEGPALAHAAEAMGWGGGGSARSGGRARARSTSIPWRPPGGSRPSRGSLRSDGRSLTA